MIKEINGFVLAGGKSSRMGQDKALLRTGGIELALRAAQILSPFVKCVTFLGPPERCGRFGFPVLADQWPGQGPLAAICTGLLSSTLDWNIFLACDLPLVTQQFIRLLVLRTGASHDDAVVPRTADGWQPLCAAYHSRCLSVFEGALHAGERSVIKSLEQLHTEAITPEEMRDAGLGETEFSNVNTPVDWARLSDLAKSDD
jgi:molybdopterin-guanine dinucleotide biosynthesis protein A